MDLGFAEFDVSNYRVNLLLKNIMVETSKAAEAANKTNATEDAKKATDAPAVVEMSPLCEETFNEP